jgi:hypothetical protein
MRKVFIQDVHPIASHAPLIFRPLLDCYEKLLDGKVPAFTITIGKPPAV